MKSWLSDAVIYHIFIDRFVGYRNDSDATKPDFCGGNIKGIFGKLQHIKNLGANTIWISPFYETSAYHGYHITNFEKTDTRFGSINDIKKLIKECHNINLKIIADIVPNHCSSKHPWFVDAQNNKQSKYFNWFYFEKWPHSYLRFLEFNDLPKLNLENWATAEYMTGILKYWASLGFDGFRIDHVVGIPDKFLIKLQAELLKINKEFVLLGEAWADGIQHKHLKTLKFKGKYSLWKKGFNQIEIQKHYSGIINGILDFGWRELVVKKLNLIKKDIKKFELLLQNYNKIAVIDDLLLIRFLDNHDTNRIMYLCNNDVSLFRKTLNILTIQDQPIIIYNGTEFGATQKNNISIKIPHSDLQVRANIPWKGKAKYSDYISSLLNNRNDNQKH